MNVTRARARVLTMRRELDELLADLESLEQGAHRPLEWMTVKDYAAHRGVSVSTIFKWRRLGLPARTLGRTVRINVREADTWEESDAIYQSAARSALGGSR